MMRTGMLPIKENQKWSKISCTRSYKYISTGPMVLLRNEGQMVGSVQKGLRWFIFTITANFGYGPYRVG